MTPFEQAASDILIPDNDTENVIESQGSDDMIIDFQNGAKLCTASLNRKKWINLLEEYAKSYPDEVQIKHRNKDGSIVAYFPVSYLRIKRPFEYSEEQRKAFAERAAQNFKHNEPTRET